MRAASRRFALIVLLGAAGCGSGGMHAPTGAAGAGGPAGGGGGAGAGAAGGLAGTDAGADVRTDACDRNGDGLDEVATCLTAPVTLRFVNATAGGTFDVWVTGAAAPVTTALVPYAVLAIGPVQARPLEVEFRAASGAPAVAHLTPAASTHETIVVYDAPPGSPAATATASDPQPLAGDCGGIDADVDFWNFTTLPPPAIVFYATNGGADWTAVLSPGLAIGQSLGSGCWNTDAPVTIGAGAPGATRAARSYQPTSFAPVQSYQLLLTDDRIIQIDGLDQVSYLRRVADAPADAGYLPRD